MGECCLPEGEEVGSRVGLVVGSTVGLSDKSNAMCCQTMNYISTLTTYGTITKCLKWNRITYW